MYTCVPNFLHNEFVRKSRRDDEKPTKREKYEKCVIVPKIERKREREIRTFISTRYITFWFTPRFRLICSVLWNLDVNFVFLAGLMASLREELRADPSNNIKTTTVHPFFLDSAPINVKHWEVKWVLIQLISDVHRPRASIYESRLRREVYWLYNVHVLVFLLVHRSVGNNICYNTVVIFSNRSPKWHWFPLLQNSAPLKSRLTKTIGVLLCSRPILSTI